jgi:hypothetical protein
MRKPLSCMKKLDKIRRWEDTPEYLSYKSEKAWYEKVTSKSNGEFYQAEGLIKRDLVPPDWKPPHVDVKGKPLKYPIKHTNCIIRIRIADGSEWLKSRQQWYGLDLNCLWYSTEASPNYWIRKKGIEGSHMKR